MAVLGVCPEDACGASAEKAVEELVADLIMTSYCLLVSFWDS